ncbi:unnamed protein product [Dracunculus medinensis]|uniref:Uncharacterized protein n=1 Tax=Dracunculus medinensis TaxID=318479 RepID=A0A3P7PTH6_DRAME|nr:unnamed protein product [Dracunculus medinensis]
MALLIILSILVLLLVLFMARFCCCCARSNKDQYIVTPIPKYKTMEPLFISTPALTEPFYGAHFDAIYSTPYSGTPLPPPHFPRLEIHPARSASISQTATPVSTHRHRIRPFPHTQITRSFSPSETPLPSSRQEISKVDDSTQVIFIFSNISDSDSFLAKRSDSRSDEPSTSLPVAPDVASLQRSIGYAESDLSFLDPRRKLEVQTRTDFFY